MAQEFLPNSDDSDRPNDGSAVAEQEILRVAVTGSRDGVLQTISTLHQLGFAKAGDWSRLQIRRRLKPRLHKQNPPPRVEEWSLKITRSSSVPRSDESLSRNGFNRLVF